MSGLFDSWEPGLVEDCDDQEREAWALALRRTAETGIPCCIVRLGHSRRATVFDLTPDGDVTDLGLVPLD